jgi:hypothetical protein
MKDIAPETISRASRGECDGWAQAQTQNRLIGLCQYNGVVLFVPKQRRSPQLLVWVFQDPEYVRVQHDAIILDSNVLYNYATLMMMMMMTMMIMLQMGSTVDQCRSRSTTSLWPLKLGSQATPGLTFPGPSPKILRWVSVMRGNARKL